MRGPKKSFAPRGPSHPLAGKSRKAPPKPAPGSPVAAAAATPAEPSAPRERPLDGEGRPYITLAQLLKMARIVESGGEAKHRVRAGDITVNGEPEARPGRKLHAGDVVVVDGDEIEVDLGEAPAADAGADQ